MSSEVTRVYFSDHQRRVIDQDGSVNTVSAERDLPVAHSEAWESFLSLRDYEWADSVKIATTGVREPPTRPPEGVRNAGGVTSVYLGVIFVILLPCIPRPAISPFCPKTKA